MKINDITNGDAAALIKETIDSVPKDKKNDLITQICKQEDQRQNMDVDAHQDDHDLHAHYTWRTTKLSSKTIAQKFCLTAVKVSK